MDYLGIAVFLVIPADVYLAETERFSALSHVHMFGLTFNNGWRVNFSGHNQEIREDNVWVIGDVIFSDRIVVDTFTIQGDIGIFFTSRRIPITR